jgi:ribosomal protein S6--L-glutamate ligase
MIQRFVAESKGKDIRAFVVGDKVVASMERIASGDEFRSNIHRGATGRAIKLTNDQEILALKAAKHIGLNLAGVDLIESDKGNLVVEVNPSPGFQGLEEATGLNIARTIIKYAVRFARDAKR